MDELEPIKGDWTQQTVRERIADEIRKHGNIIESLTQRLEFFEKMGIAGQTVGEFQKKFQLW